jgi:hypothetical protein
VLHARVAVLQCSLPQDKHPYDRHLRWLWLLLLTLLRVLPLPLALLLLGCTGLQERLASTCVNVRHGTGGMLRSRLLQQVDLQGPTQHD